MSVHPDKTARRAVDACGGIYTAAEEGIGFAAGHRAAISSAMMAVREADALTADLLEALMAAQTIMASQGWGRGPTGRAVDAAISRATEAQP